ncbi:hypothetical protein GCM10007916_26230 [Psychromonas marina]|uniref:Uncharacterized protein n=1 Tax=Psychromonas marina TaxID=88364 RepID=A0ABQ6E2T3_9GAMM|nr:hypothetical protein [Psychromonas marina]GLS91554.1 hypothetical protein GCM10007916_26230 [Psychromonas marina]
MKITRIVAISLTAALAFGCRYDAPEEEQDPGTIDPPAECTPGVDCEEVEVVANSVLILDDSTEEAGEMRFNLPSAQPSGELSVNIKVDSADEKLSYITLFGSSTSTSNAILDLKMGGKNSDYASDAGDDETVIKLRENNDSAGNKVEDQDTGLAYPGSEWVNVSLKWGAGEVIITLKNHASGEEIGSYTSPMQNVLDVEKITFKISDSGGVTTTDAPYYIDDIFVYDADGVITYEDSFNAEEFTKTYSTKASVVLTDAENANPVDEDDGGEEPGEPSEPSEVFENFDSYETGVEVSLANGSAWKTWNTGEDELGAYALAEITETQSFSGTKSLYLFDGSTKTKPSAALEFSAGEATEGSVSFYALLPAESEEEGTVKNAKSTYFNIGTSKDNSGRYFEIKVSGSGKIQYEAGDSDPEITTITAGEWVKYELSWTAENQVTVKINGVDFGPYEQIDTGLTGGTPTQFTVYTGDNSGNNNTAYIDDVDSELF